MLLVTVLRTRVACTQKVLLQGKDGNYNSPVDIWSAGCIMAELLEMRPLFPGTSQVDQAYKIVCILGQPNSTTWPTGYLTAATIKIPAGQATSLSAVVPHATMAQQSLLRALLQWNPQTRPTAHQALMHECFENVEDVADLDPRRRRSSINTAHLHAEHIERDISEEEAGRMVGATLLTTLKAVSMFKRGLRKARSEPGGLGEEVRANVSAGSAGSADAAILFDMEAEMDAIAAMMGGGVAGGDGGSGAADMSGEEEEDVCYPTGYVQWSASGAGGDADADADASDNDKVALRKQSAGSDAFDALLAEQEDELGVNPQLSSDHGSHRNSKPAACATRKSSLVPRVASIEEDFETEEQRNPEHLRSSPKESQESPVRRELSVANLANHDEHFEKADSTPHVVLTHETPNASTAPAEALPTTTGGFGQEKMVAAVAPAPAEPGSREYGSSSPSPLCPAGEEEPEVHTPQRLWSRDTDHTESSWDGSNLSGSRPGTAQSLLGRPGTGYESMPGTPLSPMTPVNGASAGRLGGAAAAAAADGGGVPAILLSPLQPGAEYDPLGDVNRHVERGWAQSRWGGIPLPTIPTMTLEQLEARKRIFKHALRKFETRFAEMHGHPPTKDEKRPLKTVYRMHKALRAEVDVRGKMAE